MMFVNLTDDASASPAMDPPPVTGLQCTTLYTAGMVPVVPGALQELLLTLN